MNIFNLFGRGESLPLARLLSAAGVQVKEEPVTDPAAVFRAVAGKAANPAASITRLTGSASDGMHFEALLILIPPAPSLPLRPKAGRV